MFVRLAAAVVVALALATWTIRPSGATAPERVHVVRPAETLWSIAVAHAAGDPRRAVWRLRARNGLDSPLLRPGQRLILPSG